MSLLHLCVPFLLVLRQEQEQQQPSAPQEREIVVAARRMADDPWYVPGAVTVITRKEIERMPADNVVDLLRRTPGFFSFGANRGPHDHTADFRGFNNGGGNGQRIVVLIDGRRHLQSGGDDVDWAATVPLDAVERIEIVRGPLAALQGNGGIAGVVNIVTRAPARETHLRVRGEAGSWATVGTSAEATHGMGDVGLYIFGRGYRTSDYRDNANFDSSDEVFRISWDAADDLAVHLKVTHHRDDRQRPGNLSRADIAAVGRRGVVLAGSPGHATTDDWSLDLSADWEVGPGDVGVLLSRRWQDRSSTILSPFGVFDLDTDADQSWGRIQYEIGPAGGEFPLRAVVGVEASDERSFDPSVFNPGTFITRQVFRRRSYGAFVLGEIEPLPGVRLTGGLRWDEARYHIRQRTGAGTGRGDPVDKHLSPIMGVWWEPRRDLALFGAWSRAARFPNRDEQIFFFPPLFAPSVSPLDPEIANSFEIGARWNPWDWLSISSSLFYIRVEDEIFFDPIAFMNSNIEEVVHRGVEVEAQMRPCSWLLLFASYSNVLARVEDGALEGRRWPVTPRQYGHAGITVLPFDWLDVTLTAYVVGARRGINSFVAANPDPRFELPPEARLDLQVTARWEDARVFLRVQNVLDAEYHDNFGVTGAGVRRFQPAPERSFLLGVEWNW